MEFGEYLTKIDLVRRLNVADPLAQLILLERARDLFQQAMNLPPTDDWHHAARRWLDEFDTLCRMALDGDPFPVVPDNKIREFESRKSPAGKAKPAPRSASKPV